MQIKDLRGLSVGAKAAEFWGEYEPTVRGWSQNTVRGGGIRLEFPTGENIQGA
jgi:hypothetical protein